jgi:hypothetical protein
MFVKGFLNVVPAPGGDGNHPDQGLPPVEGPVDPGYGYPLPPVASHPIAPPTYPVDPSYGVPVAPGIWPQPPRPDRPAHPIALPPPLLPTHPIYPVSPGEPTHPIAPGGPPPTAEQPIYLPGHVWPPLPPSVTGTLLCFAWIVGIGYRWIVIDADASVEHPIAPVPPTIWPSPGHPAHPIQPTPPSGPVAPPKSK